VSPDLPPALQGKVAFGQPGANNVIERKHPHVIICITQAFI